MTKENTIEVEVGEGYDIKISISKIDETHFRAIVVNGHNPEGKVYHIGEIQKEHYHDEIFKFLTE